MLGKARDVGLQLQHTPIAATPGWLQSHLSVLGKGTGFSHRPPHPLLSRIGPCCCCFSVLHREQQLWLGLPLHSQVVKGGSSDTWGTGNSLWGTCGQVMSLCSWHCGHTVRVMVFVLGKWASESCSATTKTYPSLCVAVHLSLCCHFCGTVATLS